MSLPEITVIGRVATDPRRTKFGDDKSVTNFRIAATERKVDRSTGEWMDGETFWSDVECWDELSGNVAHSLSKGDPVVVVGRVWTRDYESQNGKGSTSRIRANSVSLDLRYGWAELKKTARPARAEELTAEAGSDDAVAALSAAPPDDSSDTAYVASFDAAPEDREPAYAG